MLGENVFYELNARERHATSKSYVPVGHLRFSLSCEFPSLKHVTKKTRRN